MKILVPLDGSSKSESILPLAGRLAERWQAEILALRVVDPTLLAVDPGTAVGTEHMVEESLAYLKDLRVRFPEISLETRHEVGYPQQQIEAVAREEHCDLILMETHGRTGLMRWVLGSVAEGVARHAPCPTMLVRTQETPATFREVLIPSDGSEESFHVARRVGRFLAPETRVTLLHCTGERPQEKSEYLEVAEIRNRLRQQVDGRPWMRLDFASRPAPEGILDWLADHHCDLIAMSTHGRDGLAHLWKGSVMEAVARQARCPVLAFPPGSVGPEMPDRVLHAADPDPS